MSYSKICTFVENILTSRQQSINHILGQIEFKTIKNTHPKLIESFQEALIGSLNIRLPAVESESQATNGNTSIFGICFEFNTMFY